MTIVILTFSSGTIYIPLNEKAFEEQLKLCQHSFIAKVVHAKGETPIKLHDPNAKLLGIWNVKDWKLIFMGKWLFHVLVNSDEEKNITWAQGIGYFEVEGLVS